jgi:hypothetical protein
MPSKNSSVSSLSCYLSVSCGAGAVGFAPPQPGQPSGILPAIGILIGGFIYVIFIGGALYLGLGIYQNTKRMADAMDRQQP